MTDDELRAIEARAAAATPGPWNPSASRTGIVADDGRIWICPVGRITPVTDVEFIAAARVDIPALVAALREARDESKRWRSALRVDVAAARAERDDEHARAAMAEARLAVVEAQAATQVDEREHDIVLGHLGNADATVERLRAEVGTLRVVVEAALTLITWLDAGESGHLHGCSRHSCHGDCATRKLREALAALEVKP